MQGIIYLDTKTQDAKETKKTDPISPVSPVLQNDVLNPAMRRYVDSYKKFLSQREEPPINPITVDEIVSKIAKFYEKVRRVIDWKEENLVRRTAIERILKRRLISEISGISILPNLDPAKIAEPITLEVIRTGYFENGKIPESRIKNVEEILRKYLFILENSPYSKESALAIKTKVQFYNWIMEIAACEMDETLDYSYRENLLIDFMTESIYENLTLIPEDVLSDEDKFIQIYISVPKALYGLDDAIIQYNILKRRFPEFKGYNREFTFEFSKNIQEIWDQCKKDMNHPKRGEFQKLCEKYDAVYTIISDVMKVLEKEKNEIDRSLQNKETFTALIEQVYKKRVETLKKRLFRSAIYSTLSIFVASGASLFIFEYPVAKFFYGRFSPLALVADITIPTALMFLLVGIIKPPAKENMEVVVKETLKVTYKSEENVPYVIKLNKKVHKFFSIVYTLIYLAGGFGSLYFIYWIFKIVGTPLTSLYINTANIAVIVFAAMAIRQKSREITIKERGSILEFILDFFSIPLARIGGWLSKKWKEFNFVSVFFSTLVDTPFSSFIEILEGWRNYIKDKQAEI